MNKPLSGYQWIIIEEENKAPDFLIKKYGKVLGQLIYNRKHLFNEEFTEETLYPSLKNLLNPSLFNSLETVAYKLAESIKKNKKITVYGDYDADGITSTSLLINFFKDIGLDVRYYIPSRFQEGYGLNKNAIKTIAKNSDVMIVVDSGTSAYDELLYAKQLGLEVFVFDHHEPKNPEWKEENVHILNPKLYYDINPSFKHLASVGISFYVIILLRRLLNLDIKLKPYLDIVAIGTVADVVPLSSINRILVKNGLEIINQKKRVGIRSLIEQTSSANRDITSFDLGFVLAPRINAAGRLDDAKKAVKLLVTNDERSARVLSTELEFLNRKRQKLTERVFQEAQSYIKDQDSQTAVVVASNNWHAGVIGIVAGRLVEKYRVPAIVLSIDNGTAVASARSVSQINIYEALKNCSEYFERFGGHSAAAGFTLKTEFIDDFREKLQKTIRESAGEKPWVSKEIDMEVPLNYWTVEEVNKLKMLEPYGEKNPSPKFIAKNLRIEDFVTIGTPPNHLKFWFRDEDKKSFSGLWWGASEYSKYLSVGKKVDIVYTPKINLWNGVESVNFIINDMRFSI